MPHRLGKLAPSFFCEGVMLAVEAFITELDSARDKTTFLELLEGRVYRPRLGLPVAGESLLELPDYFIAVHRLLRQQQEKPEGDGSNLHASWSGPGHEYSPVTRPTACGFICVDILLSCPAPRHPRAPYDT